MVFYLCFLYKEIVYTSVFRVDEVFYQIYPSFMNFGSAFLSTNSLGQIRLFDRGEGFKLCFIIFQSLMRNSYQFRFHFVTNRFSRNCNYSNENWSSKSTDHVYHYNNNNHQLPRHQSLVVTSNHNKRNIRKSWSYLPFLTLFN